MRKSTLLAASSMMAMAAFSSAFAQTAPASGAETEEVIVSASRIQIQGYQAPTPVTVVGADQLARDAHTDIGDVIRQLPAFGTSSGPNNSSSANYIVSSTPGIDVVNLRQLGVLRTLVLFDNQRVVASSVSGGVDLSTMPSSLVQRIDVVTGGASAAWGSDAVAGVVNVVLNKNFDGFAANIEGGDSWKDDHRQYKAEASFGTDFDGNRGHIILSASYLASPDTFFINQRSWFKNTRLVNNPAYNGGANGQPRLIHADNVGQSQATQGGLITGCSNNGTTSVACSWRGTQFVGPNATPTPFNFGNVSGAFSNGGSAETAQADLDHLTIPLHTTTLFSHTRYKITNDISASLELNYGKSFSKNNSYVYNRYSNLPINVADNPFLPDSVRAQAQALGYSYLMLGTNNMNNMGTTGAHFTDNSLTNEAQSLGIPVSTNRRQLFRGVFSLDGSIGDNWSWNAYAQHGLARVRTVVENNVLKANYNNAVDAVRVTSANVGTSGLPIGSIACRSSLTNPTNGCQPLNVFGVGNASQAAINYITGPARAGGNWAQSVLNEDVFAASASGALPEEWSLGAGPVAVAFGAEYRQEGARVSADQNALAVNWSVGNFSAFSGHYSVAEGFGEVTVPILKDSVVQSLDFNTAGRITSYSTSGQVETWKLGVTSQVNDDVRLRGTWSFDIRAPNLQELFATGYSVSATFTDPYSGQSVNGYTLQGGNPNLKPEQSTTISGGVVLTPHWIEGLSLSADWYSIELRKAIATISTDVITAQCAKGVQLFCNQVSTVTRNGQTYLQVATQPINANSQSVSGIDFQADYTTEFLTGALNLRAIGNYMDQQSQTAAGITLDYAGAIGSDSSPRGIPKFRSTLSASYIEGPWQGTIQSRIIGSAKLNNSWGPLDVDNNAIPAVAYLDLRASYKWNDNIQLYGAIDNVINTPPPIPAATSNALNFYDQSIRDDIYDAIGRSLRIGIRVKY
ncbi:MAG: TonB-dependent receptor [Alphaproteobacteria bacterium]|nr:TonB-dependent receptor [Alphaproteobacteria bacterium]